jgi:hypothetical protein
VFLAIVLCWGGFTILMAVLHRQYLAQLPDSAFLVAPRDWYYWALPTFPLGIVTAAVPLVLIYRRLLGQRFTDFMEWELGRAGYTNRLILFGVWVPVMLLVCVLVPTVAVGACLRWHVRFTEQEIAVQDAFGGEEQVYGYDRVRDLAHSTHLKREGKPSQQDRYYVTFDDGRVLNSSRMPNFDPSADEYRRMIEFVSRKTGKPIRLVQFPDEVRAGQGK